MQIATLEQLHDVHIVQIYILGLGHSSLMHLQKL